MKTIETTYKLAIEAQILDSTMVGGISTYLAALVRALGLLDGPERYSIVCAEENPDWLNLYLGLNQEIVLAPRRKSRQITKRLFGKNWLRVWAKGYHLVAGAMTRFSNHDKYILGAVTEMQGFYEKTGARLVHVFPQLYVHTDFPVVFNPHDLQHEHFPEFFTPEELAKRRFVYRTACEKAKIIVTASRYTKEDVMSFYQIPADKIKIIPFAPATEAHETVIDDNFTARVLEKYGITLPFIFYPAATWEHKNHLRLLEAILKLRQSNILIPLVCTGRQLNPAWTKITDFLNENQLSDQIKFLGLIGGDELRALYKSCLFVVAPSLFEQASGPMVEAWMEGSAVASSNVTSLPEQAQDAALLFDPYSVDAIAHAIEQLWSHEAYRKELEIKGRRRLSDFSWDYTAKAYRALYRQVAQWPLLNEDHDLLRAMS